MTEQRRNSLTRFRGSDESTPLAWEDIRGDATWQGRWVALDSCALVFCSSAESAA